MYVWHVCNKLQKWSQANKWCLRVIALHSRTWTLRELIVSLHWCHARAVKWATNIGKQFDILRVTCPINARTSFPQKLFCHIDRKGKTPTGKTFSRSTKRLHPESMVSSIKDKTNRQPSKAWSFSCDGKGSLTESTTSSLPGNVTETTSTITPGKYWHLPSDLQNYQRNSLEMHGATLRSGWLGKTSAFLTARGSTAETGKSPIDFAL